MSRTSRNVIDFYERRSVGSAVVRLHVIAVILFVLFSSGRLWGEGSASSEFNRPASFPNEWTNGSGVKFRLIPAGEFRMGAHLSAEIMQRNYPESGPDSYKDIYPRHQVRITKPFYMGTYPVTVGQFSRFVKETGYITDAEKKGSSRGYDSRDGQWKEQEGLGWRSPGFSQNASHPVVAVTWDDARAFIDWMNRSEKTLRRQGLVFRYALPTEAQWEYACRAGTETDFYWGERPEDGKPYLNAADQSGCPAGRAWKVCFPFRDGWIATSPVGSFLPNDFGLYDMHGNVSEWCFDWYDPNYYSISPVEDPTGPAIGQVRVDRGGGWYSVPHGCRSSYRGKLDPCSSSCNLGFRVVLTTVNETQQTKPDHKR